MEAIALVISLLMAVVGTVTGVLGFRAARRDVQVARKDRMDDAVDKLDNRISRVETKLQNGLLARMDRFERILHQLVKGQAYLEGLMHELARDREVS